MQMKIPTADGLYEIPPHVRVGLYARYRGVDVDREIQMMGLWLEKNPARARKIVKPIRFMENWLKKIYGKRPKHATPVPGEQPVRLVHSSNGASAQPSRHTVAGVATPPLAPPSTGPAADPPALHAPATPSLAPVPAGGADPVRLNGPRPLSDVFRDLKSKIGVKG